MRTQETQELRDNVCDDSFYLLNENGIPIEIDLVDEPLKRDGIANYGEFLLCNLSVHVFSKFLGLLQRTRRILALYEVAFLELHPVALLPLQVSPLGWSVDETNKLLVMFGENREFETFGYSVLE